MFDGLPRFPEGLLLLKIGLELDWAWVSEVGVEGSGPVGSLGNWGGLASHTLAPWDPLVACDH